MARNLTAATLLLATLALPLGADELTIRREVVVKAPLETVWRAWTTNEGAREWFSEWTNIDARPGGPYEIFFSAPGDAPAGQRGCEGCTVLAVDPQHMLSFTWNAPPKFGPLRSHQTHVTVRFESRSPDETLVRFLHEGFGDTGEWPAIHAYFERAWGAYVLPNLVKRFEE